MLSATTVGRVVTAVNLDPTNDRAVVIADATAEPPQRLVA